MSDTNAKVLVIAEHDSLILAAETLKTVTAAQQLGQFSESMTVDVLVIGENCESVIQSTSCVKGVSQVLVVDADIPVAEAMTSIVSDIAEQYTHLMAAATTFGKNLMPRIAAGLDVGQLSDVSEICGLDTIVRPIYAGNALAKVRSLDPIKVLTIRAASFEKAVMEEVPVATITHIDEVSLESPTQFVSVTKTESERPELTSANVVVSGGRGLGSKENFELVEQLADALGGAVGASRAAVDAGFVPNDMQVGQTGKIVSPDLYLAVGISGAIQHIAGIKDSKVIVAINSDPDAPIFDVADYGLVGDLFEIVPELITKVSEV